ncbi:MAG: LysE family translocator [Betaproteobacteria bacterium]|nr:LysE family translocator [Betaproteobacteria bacterium]
MTELLPPWPLLTAFLAASFVLAVTPGPGVLYIVARSLGQGRSCGLASVAGVATGNLCNALGASIGLAAVFAVSATAFTVIKYAGAAYLIYLGVRTLRRAPVPTPAPQALPARTVRRIFADGFVVALLNPKTTLFFAAFLPQFMSSGAPPMQQSAALGTLFVAMAAVTDTVYALAAGTIAAALGRSPGVMAAGRTLTGAIFIALGAFAALADTRR